MSVSVTLPLTAIYGNVSSILNTMPGNCSGNAAQISFVRQLRALLTRDFRTELPILFISPQKIDRRLW
jgi:hypothetical protein